MTTKVGAWSVNTWRTRYALKYKGIPFTTTWLELCDVEREMIAAGAPPSGKWADGRPKYTVPTIYDSLTKEYITDCHEIARYLDKTYPDKPLLFPHNTSGLQHVFTDTMFQKVAFAFFPAILEHGFKIFNERTQVYFRETREKIFGKKLEEIWGDEVAVKKAKADGKEGLKWVEAMVKENGDTALFLLGDSPVDADFAIASVFQWIKKGYPAMWEELKGLNGGRWARFMEAMHQYEDEN
ncbi:hypothetical protein K525DRAFT_232458 [Schizophyllum commune Loenen D]|nr:hypothetical protein K525DRAFT_232458 [Schizophyllum commune Loenen D]